MEITLKNAIRLAKINIIDKSIDGIKLTSKEMALVDMIKQMDIGLCDAFSNIIVKARMVDINRSTETIF